MLEFRTQGFNGYAVKYSPFYDNRIAVASAANFGLVGNGRLYILELTANGIQPLKQYYTTPPILHNPPNIFLDSQPKTPSLTSPGPKPTKTSASPPLATAR
jgi:hypothetical protein